MSPTPESLVRNPGRHLDPNVKALCDLYWLTGDKAESYREVYGEATGKTPVASLAFGILDQQRSKRYLDYLGKPDVERSLDTIREMLDDDKPSVRQAAAKIFLDREQKANSREGIERWAQIMSEIGAEVVRPVRPGEKDITVSFNDVVRGGAYLNLPFEAMIDLLHRSGAPWNDAMPNATLSTLQKEILRRSEREIIVHGGSGVGKSVLSGCYGVSGLAIPNFRIAVVGSTYDHGGIEFQYIHQGFLALFGEEACTRCVNINRNQHHDMEITTHWGSFCRVYSTDRGDGEQLLGKEFNLIILGEGSYIENDIFQRKMLRAIDRRSKVDPQTGYQRKTGCIVIFTTPQGYDGCSAAEWDRVMKTTKGDPEYLHDVGKVSWLNTVYLREAAVDENPSYSKEVMEARRISLPRDVFEEQYLGKMTRRTGLVIKEYSESHHVKRIPNAERISKMRLAFSMDTGKHFSAGLHGIEPDWTMWRLGEVRADEQKISDNTDEMKALLVTILGPIYLSDNFDDLKDRVDLWTVDARSQHKEELYDLLDVPLVDADFPLLGSIDRVRGWFREDKLFIASEHTIDPIEGNGIRWELPRYQWRRVKTMTGASKTQLEPKKMDDHSIDDLRYGLIPLHEMGPKAIKEAQSTSFVENYRDQTRDEVIGSLVRGMRDRPAVNIGEEYRRVHGFH